MWGSHEDIDCYFFLLYGVGKVPVDLGLVVGTVFGTDGLVDVDEEVVADEAFFDGSDAQPYLSKDALKLRKLIVIVEDKGASDEAGVIGEVVDSADETEKCEVFLVLGCL